MIVFFEKILNKIIADKYLKSESSKKLFHEITKFIFFGILNNVILILAYQILLFFINYKTSAILMYIMGYILALYVNAVYVFKNQKIKFNSRIKYAVFYVFLCFLNYYMLLFFSAYLNINPRLSIFIVIFMTTFLSFALSRKILSNRVSSKG